MAIKTYKGNINNFQESRDKESRDSNFKTKLESNLKTKITPQNISNNSDFEDILARAFSTAIAKKVRPKFTIRSFQVKAEQSISVNNAISISFSNVGNTYVFLKASNSGEILLLPNSDYNVEIPGYCLEDSEWRIRFDNQDNESTPKQFVNITTAHEL